MAESSDQRNQIDGEEKVDDNDDVDVPMLTVPADTADVRIPVNANETSNDNMDTNQNEDQSEEIKTANNGAAEEGTATNIKRSNGRYFNLPLAISNKACYTLLIYS